MSDCNFSGKNSLESECENQIENNTETDQFNEEIRPCSPDIESNYEIDNLGIFDAFNEFNDMNIDISDQNLSDCEGLDRDSGSDPNFTPISTSSDPINSWSVQIAEWKIIEEYDLNKAISSKSFLESSIESVLCQNTNNSKSNASNENHLPPYALNAIKIVDTAPNVDFSEDDYEKLKTHLIQLDVKKLVILNLSDTRIVQTYQPNNVLLWGTHSRISSYFAFIIRDEYSDQLHLLIIFSQNKVISSLNYKFNNILSQSHSFDFDPQFRMHNSESKQSIARFTLLYQENIKPLKIEKTSINCYYVGLQKTHCLARTEEINDIIYDLICYNNGINLDDWTNVNVSIESSLVSIRNNTIDSQEYNKILFEFRIRYMAFLSVYTLDSRFCGIIVENENLEFIVYVFYQQPSTIEFCKNLLIECRLRFQKQIEGDTALSTLNIHDTKPLNQIKNNVKNKFRKLMESFRNM